MVDDGSSDGTAEAAERIAEPRLRLIRQANAGVSAARNRGAAEARGEFFLFLDSDDRLRPDALERLGVFLAARPDADMAYGELATTGEDGRLRHGGRPVFGPRPSGRILPALLAGGFMVPGMALMRAEAFRRSGGFDESLRLSQDWEFLCRMAARSEILYLPGPPVLEYRLRSSSATQLRGGGDAGFAERMRAIDRAYGNPAVTGGFSPASWPGCAGDATPIFPPGWGRWRCGGGTGYDLSLLLEMSSIRPGPAPGDHSADVRPAALAAAGRGEASQMKRA